MGDPARFNFHARGVTSEYMSKNKTPYWIKRDGTFYVIKRKGNVPQVLSGKYLDPQSAHNALVTHLKKTAKFRKVYFPDVPRVSE